MKTLKKYSIIQVYLYGLMKREVKEGNIIHISQINTIIKRAIRIPRQYQYEVLNELIAIGLLKRLGRDNFEIKTEIMNKPLYDSLGEPLWQ